MQEKQPPLPLEMTDEIQLPPSAPREAPTMPSEREVRNQLLRSDFMVSANSKYFKADLRK